MSAHVRIKNKASLFRMLARHLSSAAHGLDTSAIHDALWERERAQRTGIGQGIAFPHCTLRGVPRTYVGVFTLYRPIEYGKDGGEAVDVVFASLGPPDDRQTHLLVLAAFATLVARTDVVTTLRAARSREAVLAAIEAGLAELRGSPAS